MATRRKCFLVDAEYLLNVDTIYCFSLKVAQNQFAKYKTSYLQDIPDITDDIVYTSVIMQDLRNMKIKHLYIQHKVLEFTVDG